MPEYKKKKVRRRSKRARAPADFGREPTEKIPMHAGKPRRSEPANEKKVRVIKGKKLEQRRNIKVVTVTALLLAAVCVILHALLPIGILENLGNVCAVFGSGSYPIELYGAETLNTVQKGMYYYVLTDTELGAYSNSGKKIYSYSHGYARPVLKTGETRALIFDQGGLGLEIYNLHAKTNSLTAAQPILSAAISRCGAYAVATMSDSYASVVSVYDRHDQLLYEWYSATDSVNGVLLSPDGKKLIVSTVNASGGLLQSRVLVLQYQSANAVFSVEYSGEAVYALEALRSGFAVLTADGCSYFSWSDYERRDFQSDYSLALSKNSPEGLALVFNRTSDKSDNHVLVISPKGEQTAAFDFKGQISDITFSDNHIYCISDTAVYMLDRSGGQIASAECDFGAVRLSSAGSQALAVISNSDITLLKMK